MGSKPADQKTANAATAGAQQSDQALAKQANDNNQFDLAARKSLFGYNQGTGAFDGSGTLSGFLDPTKLNVQGPTGAFKASYNNAVANIAKGAASTQGSISRYMANRGFGDAPSGFEADQQRRAGQQAAADQGNAFADATNASYQDALQNFWRASGMMSGEGDAALSASLAGNTAAANNYANLYGSAIAPRPTTAGSILGAASQTGGQIGAAAAGNPKPPKPPAGDPSLCWIAAAVYGDDDPRTLIVRRWISGDLGKTTVGALIVLLYRKYGERIARLVKKSRFLKVAFRPLFDRALSDAMAIPQTRPQAPSAAMSPDYPFEGKEYQR